MKKSILILSLFFSASFAFANNCEERRGALDFGSGTTKAFAAVVDICAKKIVSVLYEDRLPLALNEALEKSSTKEIPAATVQAAYPKIKNFVAKMKELQVTRIEGVATSVFRVAKNGKTTAEKISEEIGIPVQVISQEREAELGYWSALAQKKIEPTELMVVWDIGGGSMQMYSRDHGKVHIYQGDLASVTFKNKILQVLQFKNPAEVSSPNPLGMQKEAALQLAKNHAYLNVPKYFKEIASKARWIGVGGVLSASVQRQAHSGAHEFTSGQLGEALNKRAQLNDSQLEGDYKISDVSNLALVLGYMQALKISKVETVQASLGQGLIYQSLQSK
ncbi:hypothetical protein AZI87_13900 [Bdellovibrio bacteriovorus]|uniref:Ppx/GppA phosphatase N-terminal domain-containing protein n=1 Tax=Bdellovibrio bacteriovorus TaxID=959 RepID=A0A161PB89_BDEBC|nr:hypothetical protein [Bdellovibrio bacteriovorus]KYG64322.1 hypothetical protein AZI87_13900 [Bdellovibrio bacteriovorus]